MLTIISSNYLNSDGKESIGFYEGMKPWPFKSKKIEGTPLAAASLKPKGLI